MTLKQVAVCPSGHPQTYVRGDRRGGCTRCGAALQLGVADDSVPVGFINEKGRFEPTEEAAPDAS